MTESGYFIIEDDRLARNNTLLKYEKSLTSIIRTAAFVGRWFASASSVESIYAQLGMRP